MLITSQYLFLHLPHNTKDEMIAYQKKEQKKFTLVSEHKLNVTESLVKSALARNEAYVDVAVKRLVR